MMILVRLLVIKLTEATCMTMDEGDEVHIYGCSSYVIGSAGFLPYFTVDLYGSDKEEYRSFFSRHVSASYFYKDTGWSRTVS